LNYIRINKIKFDSFSDSSSFINLEDDFNKTIEHLLELFNSIKTRCKKKKKNIPDNIKKSIDDALEIIESEKEKHNGVQISKEIDINKLLQYRNN
jgi:uncharacterized protein (UPF0147 family)